MFFLASYCSYTIDHHSVFFSENPRWKIFPARFARRKKSKSEPSFLDVLANYIFFVPNFLIFFWKFLEIMQLWRKTESFVELQGISVQCPSKSVFLDKTRWTQPYNEWLFSGPIFFLFISAFPFIDPSAALRGVARGLRPLRRAFTIRYKSSWNFFWKIFT